MINGHGGNIYALSKALKCSPDSIIDFSSNINPLGPMDGLTQYLNENLDAILRLPEVDAGEMNALFSEFYDVPKTNCLSANGTTQFIYTLPLALGIKKAIILSPTYSDYQDALGLHHSKVTHLMGNEENNFKHDMGALDKMAGDTDAVFICNPNNPTGQLIPKSVLMELIAQHRNTLFVLDESYLPFVPGSHELSLIRETFPNLIILSSMSKIFRIPGLRIGFITADMPLIQKIRPFLMPWSVNSLAQMALTFIYLKKEETIQFISSSQNYLLNEKSRFFKWADANPAIDWVLSTTPFFMGKLPGTITAKEVWEYLSQKKILIRNCANFKGLSEKYIRISLKTDVENDKLTQHLSAFFQSIKKHS